MELDVIELRRQAEARLAERMPRDGDDDVERKRLLHELQVHQVELEMQNEALREQQMQTQAALKKFADLNDHLEETVAMRTAEVITARELAEAANRAKSAFLANMSHELRTPMSAIMGMTTLAARLSHDPKQQDYLQKSLDASRRLLTILNDILDISKIEADHLTLEHVPFTLDEVLQQLNDLVGDRVREKQLTLAIKIDPALAGMALVGDSLRVNQILLNLVSNAIKFTDSGGVVLRVAMIEESGKDLLFRFEVEDTGSGVPVEYQKRIFMAFEQADNSTTRKFGGTGLGLAIAKRLAAIMGGQIGLESSTGHGSTFWVTVRLQKAEPTQAGLPRHPVDGATRELMEHFAGTKILLVEDEALSREVTTNLLEDAGLDVDVAEDGAIAVAMAHETAYRLILMDIQMPELNGIEAVRRIRRIPGRESIPILALTANAYKEDREAYYDAGMNDHLLKPFEPERLYAIVLKWLLAGNR